jgi:diguanylate cyclase (GGDEF)-like protein/PAS domain S-box-containing protein
LAALLEMSILSEATKMSADEPASSPGHADPFGERRSLVVIGMGAVFGACVVFTVVRGAITLRTGRPTPWWMNLLGFLAIAGLYFWYRRSPETRSGMAVHGTALVATMAVLGPYAYGLTSSIWWLSLILFAVVLLGRRREVWVWGISIPLIVIGATLLESRFRPADSPPESFFDSTLSMALFVPLLGGMAAAFRGIAERRALALRLSEEKTRALAEELRESRQKLLLVLDNIPELVFWKDRESVYQGCNTNFAIAAGVGTPPAIVGKTDFDLPWKETEAEKYRYDDREVMESGRSKLRFSETQSMADGKLAYVETSKIPLQDAEGMVVGVLGTYEDVTERRAAEMRIEHLAFHDGLTGLPNRMLLEDRLGQAVATARRHGRMIAVLFLDLDGFKSVNDRHGHEGGDAFLRETGRRLASCIRSGDTAARLGWDEFVVLLVEVEGRSDLLGAIERVMTAIRHPVVFEGSPVSLTASLGVALYPEPQSSGEDLLRYADAAMYQAKESGRDRYVFFDPAVARGLPTHHRDWEAVAAGFANREFALVYQPTVNLRTGDVIGAEALVRWDAPGRDRKLPREFLPSVERTDLIIDIGSWVLEEALSRLETWRSSGLDVKIGINVSARQIQHPGFFDVIRSALESHPLVPPDRLEVEILETTALDDVGVVQGTMARCRDLGVRFCLDDFGTGYSSLSYLKRFPVEVVKIDQSFVQNMLDDPEDLAIVEAVLSMAAAFGRQVVAEGVNSPGHPPLLLRLGCELAQGYFIGRPMSGEDFPAFVREWRPDAAWLPKAGER